MFAIILVVIILNKPEVYGYGIAVTSDRFPYQAGLRLYYNNNHHCSGTIISSQFILTAAHCVCHNIKYYMVYVVVGANSFTQKGQNYHIADAICHEDFEAEHLLNDIALLGLTYKLKFSKQVKPIPLINSKLPRNAMCLLSIWEYNKNYVVPPSKFKILFVTLFDVNYCSSLYPGYYINNTTNICTFSKGQGACIGDSGGPVVYKGYLVGLISYGKKCQIHYPNVHTSIAGFVDWIKEQIFFYWAINEL